MGQSFSILVALVGSAALGGSAHGQGAGHIVEPEVLASSLHLGGDWEEVREWGRGLGSTDSRFGQRLVLLDDVDADGTPDLGVTRLSWTGWSLQAFSLRSGRLLWAIPAPPFHGYDLLEDPVLVGDFDGDGIRDIAAGFPEDQGYDGTVSVFSGRTGSLHAVFHPPQPGLAWRFGTSVAGLEDLDGDAIPELLIGAPANPANGTAFVISGGGGSVLREYSFPQVPYFFSGGGHTVAALSDLDGDGFSEHLVGAKSASPNGIDHAGMVFLYSGATGSLLREILGEESQESIGRGGMGGAPDLDGDGKSDIILFHPGDPVVGGWPAGFFIKALSGVSGQTLWKVSDPSGAETRFASCLGFLGDLDHDGIDDVLVGRPGDLQSSTEPGTGEVLLLSGASGRLLRMVAGKEPGSGFGASAAWLQDPLLCPDGALVVGVPGKSTPTLGDGGVGLYRFTPFAWAMAGEEVSASAGGQLPLFLNFPPQAAGMAFQLLGSLSTGPMKMGSFLVPVGDDPFYRFLEQSGFAGTVGSLNSNGDSLTVLDLPPGALSPLVGRTIWLAAIAGAPHPAYTSVALPFSVLP